MEHIPKQEARAADCREKRAAIAADVPTWTLTLAPDAPPNTEVKRNGELVGAAMLGIEMPVDPGIYVLTTQAPGGPVTEKRVEIVKAAKVSIVLEVALVPIVKESTLLPKPIAMEKSTPPRRIAGWVFVGTGAAFLGGGLIAGAMAVSNKTTAAENCGAAIGMLVAPTVCNEEGKAIGGVRGVW